MKTYLAVAVLSLALASNLAQAQTMTVFGPLGSPVTTYYAPSVAYSPVVAAPTVAYYGGATEACCQPTTNYGYTAAYAAPTTSYYASYYAPTTSYYPTTVAAPVTSYYAPTTSYYSPSVSYYQPSASYYQTYSPVVTYATPGVVGSNLYDAAPQVYVPGQPVRNTLRWALP